MRRWGITISRMFGCAASLLHPRRSAALARLEKKLISYTLLLAQAEGEPVNAVEDPKKKGKGKAKEEGGAAPAEYHVRFKVRSSTPFLLSRSTH